MRRYAIGHQGSTWQLDHRAHVILDGHAMFTHYLPCHFFDQLGLLPQFLAERHQRHHDLELHFLPFALHLAGSLENRPTLHSGHFRKQQAQATTAKSEHGIRLAYSIYLAQQQAFLVNLIEHVIHITKRIRAFQRHLQFRQLIRQLFSVRQKLMERRVKQSDRHGQAGHLTKDTDKVSTLQRQQLFERLLASADTLGKNHLAHSGEPLVSEEHVLSTTEANTFSAKLSCRHGIELRIGVRPYAQTAKLIGPRHQLVEIIAERWLYGWHLAKEYPTC